MSVRVQKHKTGAASGSSLRRPARRGLNPRRARRSRRAERHEAAVDRAVEAAKKAGPRARRTRPTSALVLLSRRVNDETTDELAGDE